MKFSELTALILIIDCFLNEGFCDVNTLIRKILKLGTKNWKY